MESDLRHEQRLYLLDGWRESPFYSERERAALGWCEAVTRIAETHAPDDCYEAARAQFKKKEFVESTFAIVAINGAYRLNIAFRTIPGDYQMAKVASGGR